MLASSAGSKLKPGTTSLQTRLHLGAWDCSRAHVCAEVGLCAGMRAAKLIDQVYCAMRGLPYPGSGAQAAEPAAHGSAGLPPGLIAGAAQGCGPS